MRKSLKVLCTTADATPVTNDEFAISQKLEGQDVQAIRKGTSSAQQLTISFWVKSNRTGTYIVWVYDNDNNRSVSKSYTVNSSATWEYKTINIPADTTGVFDNDNNGSLWVRFYLGAGPTFTSGTLQTTWGTETAANRCVGQVNLADATNNYWQITGVQMTIGSVDTPFEFKSYADELRECQRYYALSNVAVRAVPRYADGVALSTIMFKVSMRAAPTVTVNNLAGTNIADASGTDGFKTYSTGAQTNNEGSFGWTAAIEL